MTTEQPTVGILVIFGITGDLARKKLLPALYHLVCDNLIADDFVIVGVTRRQITTTEILAKIESTIESADGSCDVTAMQRLKKMMRIATVDMTRDADYHELKSVLDDIEREKGMCLNRLFYLAIPPSTYASVVEKMGAAKLNTGCIHHVAESRIMVEKPFGYNLASAKQLIKDLTKVFREEQIYRIDHYLAKETAQNILVFRFTNPVFSSIWKAGHIKSITILAAESIGVEGRAAFYEPVGALRDFVQSHLLQLLALITMDEPMKMTPASLHAAKLKLLRAITPVPPEQVAGETLRGQYLGYRDEVANPDSYTETFARIHLTIPTARWRGVPITITTGKRLDEKCTQVEIEFADHSQLSQPNKLIFRLQPAAGISLDLQAKKPGFDNSTNRIEMNYDYKYSFGSAEHPDAYERVLVDGIKGDQTLFASSAEVLATWTIIENIVDSWTKSDRGLVFYKPGTPPDQVQK